MGKPHPRMEHIDRAVASVARECGVTPTVVHVVWWYASTDGSAVEHVTRSLFGGRHPAIPNVHRAINAGALGPRQPWSDWLFEGYRCPLTPLGRRILWRIHEELGRPEVTP